MSRPAEPIAISREGEGPEILLIHGGASPEATWRPLKALSSRWTLVMVHRRGYQPSPPGRHDFQADAEDIEPLLHSGPHLVAHSYGVLGALIAASGAPRSVRSLTLIEPPLYTLVPDDADVAHLRHLANTFLTEGLEAEPAALREFLQIAGVPLLDDGPLPAEVENAVRLAHGGRLPSEARPRLDVLRDAAVPSLVASGSHYAGFERICDALAEQLRATRLIAPGAGHFVAAAPGFTDELERHLRSAAWPRD